MLQFLNGLLRLFRKRKYSGVERRRSYKLDSTFVLKDELVLTIKEVAKQQQREETQVFDDIVEAGLNRILDSGDTHGKIWDSLSPNEQAVTALLCLNYSSYEIAAMLSISYDTVRYHSKNIYKKFGMQRKELRQALKNWSFLEWWESHHR